jgi:hypothetical protein
MHWPSKNEKEEGANDKEKSQSNIVAYLPRLEFLKFSEPTLERVETMCFGRGKCE